VNVIAKFLESNISVRAKFQPAAQKHSDANNGSTTNNTGDHNASNGTSRALLYADYTTSTQSNSHVAKSILVQNKYPTVYKIQSKHAYEESKRLSYLRGAAHQRHITWGKYKWNICSWTTGCVREWWYFCVCQFGYGLRVTLGHRQWYYYSIACEW